MYKTIYSCINYVLYTYYICLAVIDLSNIKCIETLKDLNLGAIIILKINVIL